MARTPALLLIKLAALPLQAFAVAVVPFKPQCPCINTTNASASYTSVIVGGTPYRYPADYGSSQCGAWDLGLSPVCSETPAPAWCAEPWCYVNAAACHDSDTGYMKSSYHEDLFLSYRTCHGDPTSWLNSVITSAAAGKVLRVAVPASYYPDHYRYDALGNLMYWGVAEDKENGTGPYFGVYIEYVNKLAKLGNFTLDYKFVSEGSRAAQGSLWTACIMDVQLGLLDMCVGNFWLSTERLAMAPFSAPLEVDKFYMMVKRPKVDDSFMTQIGLVFAPLATKAWLLVLGVTILIGLVRCLGDVPARLSDPEHNLQIHTGTTALARSMYASLADLVYGATPPEDSNSPGMKLIVLGWAFFVLLVTCIYTASLTAALVTRELDFPIKNINDCISQRCTLCLSYLQKPLMIDTYGDNIIYIVDGEFGEELQALTGLKSNKCDAALIPENFYRGETAVRDAEFVFTGTTVLSYYVGMPVSPTFQAAVSHAQYILDGTADSTQLEAMQTDFFAPYDVDPWADPFSGAEDDEFQQVVLEQMFGPLFIFSSVVSIGLLLSCVQAGLAFRSHRQRRRSLGTESRRGPEAGQSAAASEQRSAAERTLRELVAGTPAQQRELLLAALAAIMGDVTDACGAPSQVPAVSPSVKGAPRPEEVTAAPQRAAPETRLQVL